MQTPLHNSADDEQPAGLGLAVRIAAPAKIASPNEAGARLPTNASEPEVPSPRQVIRGENHSDQPNPSAAFVDWLNFTFPFQITGTEAFVELDKSISSAFGFGLGISRNRKHLNYEQSWEIGNGYGIFATGGTSVAGTSLFSLSGEGCNVVKDWVAAHDFIERVKGRITRIDLAHDDYLGRISLQSARNWFEAGDFHAGKGHPPSGQFIDDFGSGTGKTLYVGKRKNGKLLRIYEKGRQLGNPDSPWVRWELELHNKDRSIPLRALLCPAEYLASAYPTTSWISERQSRIETAKRITLIGLDVLTEYCRKSYGKLIWTLWKVQELSPDEIVETLAVEGIPPRINHAIPGETT